MDSQATVNPETITALDKIVTPEVLDLDIIDKELGPAIDRGLRQASRIQVSVKDEESRGLALDTVEKLQDYLASLDKWRGDFYVPAYRKAEAIRENFDPRIKLGKALIKDIMAAVSEFNVRRERELRIKREAAEAEARRQAAEVERLKREAEEAERRAKEAAEAEIRRKREAEEAERRRTAAEAEAKVRAEREAREAAQRERERKIKEEEDARLRHAQEAKDQGNEHKIETILDSPTPISPILASPQVAPDKETLRIEQELAAKRAKEKAEVEAREAAEAEALRKAAEEEAAKAKAAAAEAEAAAKVAQAAASTAVVTRPDARTMTVVRFKWEFDSNGTLEGDREAFMLLVKAVAEKRAPIEYLGFDLDHPEKFRPSAINEDVQKLKERFVCPGLKAYPQEDTQFKRMKR